ncbi:MAG: hypothetical protein H6738_17860 [Alphaproteobacteria bacterium]|nr:hypothetical protein [Alphaproteobacteria bacterium]MCB9698652.1 hypothetical protein [Alphaproteobacteria bacterium]
MLLATSLLWTSTALAQRVPDLSTDPDHDAYVKATAALDLPLTTPPRGGYDPQIMPGTMGIVTIDQVPVAVTMAIPDPNSALDFIESLVYLNGPSIESINGATFQIQHNGFLAQPTVAAMDAQLALWNAADVMHQFEGAADTPGLIDGAKFGVSNNLIPDAVALANPGLLAITPADSAALDLYGFEIVQNGQIVGWLLRERRDYGFAGVEWIDRWFYRSTFKPVSNAATTLEIHAPTTLANPDGIWTIPEFIGEILQDAPVASPAGLNRMQVARYDFDLLDALVP